MRKYKSAAELHNSLKRTGDRKGELPILDGHSDVLLTGCLGPGGGGGGGGGCLLLLGHSCLDLFAHVGAVEFLLGILHKGSRLLKL